LTRIGDVFFVGSPLAETERSMTANSLGPTLAARIVRGGILPLDRTPEPPPNARARR
jgi:hypothetical protein